MSQFHASIRNVLEDVHQFLAHSLQKEVLSSASLAERGKILSSIKNLCSDYPELQIQLDASSDDTRNSKRCSSSSPLPYVDMNGTSAFKIPMFSSSVDKDSYDLCTPKEKCDSPENQSVTGSEDYASDDSKLLSEVPASDLYSSSEKSGYLDKRKRETIKGWLNPFQKRWCAIKDGVLYYYEKTSDRKQKGSIILNGYEARSLQDDSKESKKYNYCFELVCPGKRTYQFSAVSDNDRHQWIEAVEKSNKFTSLARQSQSYSAGTNVTEDSTSSVVAEDIYEIVDDEETEVNSKFDNSVNRSDVKESVGVETQSNSDQMFNFNEWYVGLWDCSAADDSELSFYRGDLIHVVSKEYDNYSWWIGELQGKVGLVPKSYLMEAYETC